MTKFVSARYVKDQAFGEMLIVATDEKGVEWWLDEAVEQSPDWQKYLDDGGEIAAYDAPPVKLDEQIEEAPADLTGGPTLGEIYGD
jgi:hypothetical protein